MNRLYFTWWLLLATVVFISCTPPPATQPTAVPLPPPTITPSPQPCRADTGEIRSLSFENDTFLATQVNIYLPPCYEAQIGQRYPVLYMLHGSGLDQNTWPDLGIAERADELINSGAIAPLIIVMPPSLSFGPKFDTFLVEQLIPTVDKQYRSQAEREGRWLAGMSFGATLVVRVGLQHAELFGKLGVLSLSYIGIDNEDAANWLDALAINEMPDFLLDVGESDRLLERHHGDFRQLLVERSIPHDHFIRSGGHTLPYWAENVANYLIWFAAS